MKIDYVLLEEEVVTLFKRISTVIPADILDALSKSKRNASNHNLSSAVLSTLLENCDIARLDSKPICQDTGTPIFFISYPIGISTIDLKKVIIQATRRASIEVPLRPNSVDSFSGNNSNNNVGIDHPVIYFEENERGTLTIDLLMKGGGSENIGRCYSLPDDSIAAARDLDGIRRCIIDAVYRAQGLGCPPMVVGVAVGSPKDAVSILSKKQLLKNLYNVHSDALLAAFEKKMLAEVNSLSIGPAGLGGIPTALGVKIAFMSRHPASFFVDVSFSCWANRRGRLSYQDGEFVHD